MSRSALPTSPWIHVERFGEPGEVLPLDRDAVRHLAGARRLRDGDEVTLFDGAGGLATAQLCDRSRAVAIVDAWNVERPAAGVIVASALPKGDRLATMLDMCVQLGIDAFIPLRCRRSVVTLTVAGRARLSRIAMEAAKQSRRPWLPEIREESTPSGIIAAARTSGATVVVADPQGEHAEAVRRELAGGPIVVLIGPEGGFDDEERRAFESIALRRLRLADGILRIETAAVAAAALLGGSRHAAGSSTVAVEGGSVPRTSVLTEVRDDNVA